MSAELLTSQVHRRHCTGQYVLRWLPRLNSVEQASAHLLLLLLLLQVSGTSQAELSLTLPGLTSLTSLRLLPADHALGGLGQLVPLKHLKKLNIK
jgi:hypothetical protein